VEEEEKEEKMGGERVENVEAECGCFIQQADDARVMAKARPRRTRAGTKDAGEEGGGLQY